MKAILVAVLILPTLMMVPSASAGTGPVAAQAAEPQHSLAVTGAGVDTYPAFDRSIERYGITTTDASTGTVEVKAGTTDKSGSVRINGHLAPNGTRTVRGLQPSDEVSVMVTDSSGTSTYSLIYLPAGLHSLTAAGTQPSPEEHTLLTLGRWTDGSGFYEVAVDGNGVPATVHPEASSSMDFKRQPNGQLSVSRGSATTPGKSGSAVVSLGDDLTPSGVHETVGLVNTDGHDSILLPDGSRYFVAYEDNPASGLQDAVIQHVSAAGEVLFEWNSADHVDPGTETVIAEGNPDYAHINSIQVMDDGDILASFRHFSAVFKIARHARGDIAEGDIVWKLGGHDSTFAFPDDPHGGPCAQHTASQLDNGNILMFDNGSWNLSPLCIDPADRTGDTIARPTTRITEYAVDEASGEAHLVWEFTHDGEQFAIFAGSAERLPNGNTLVGWASSRDAVVSEISPAKEVVWELVDTSETNLNDRQFTYRADRTTVEDVTAPQVSLPVEDGHAYHRGQVTRPAYGCTDRGGSSLASCTTTGLVDGQLDTSHAGTHTVSVTATDGAGNTTTASRSYVVVNDRPDAMIRPKSRKPFVGEGVYGSADRQTIKGKLKRAGQTSVSIVRVDNDGPLADRMRISGTKGSKRFRVSYRVDGKDVTRRIVAGTYRTPAVAPGRHWVMRVKVTRTKKARPGDKRAVKVKVRANHNATRDVVRVLNRAR